MFTHFALLSWFLCAVAAEPEVQPLPPRPALASLRWVVERNEGTVWGAYTSTLGNWVTYSGMFDRNKPWMRLRRGPTLAVRAATTVSHDVDREPWFEVEVPRTTMPWRLTGQVPGGPELMLADAQLAGRARVNLVDALGVHGVQPITLRIYGSALRSELEFGVRFLADGDRSEADVPLGELATLHGRAVVASAGMVPKTPTWPRLWWSRDTRDAVRAKASTPLGRESLGDLSARMADRTELLVGASTPAQQLEHRLLAIRPTPAPALGPLEGRTPPYMPLLRDLNWSGFNQWELASAVTDDPEVAQQARRWSLNLASWQFWRAPHWLAFDNDAGYALQALAQGYDVAHDAYTPEERARVRTAIREIAVQTYRNVLANYAYLENDLRSNHAASTLAGLGMAGLVLLGEDPDAPAWAALAELKMLEAFRIHTSGASWESAAYGRYAVDEWFRLAAPLANVTGREHRHDAFFKKHADYQVAIADWEGRDLGYNQGGASQWWNQWVLSGIAAFTRDPAHQWIGNPPKSSLADGYGERLFLVDPSVPAERPTGRDTAAYFPDIGYAVWRTGWDERDTIVAFHDGPRGTTHQDRDSGHLTLYARGHKFLPDGLGAGADLHNVVTWDYAFQNQYFGGAMSRFFQDRRAGAATGDFQGWRRVVLYLRPELVVVIDRLEVFRDDPDRVGLTLFHPKGDAVSYADGTFTVTEGADALQGTMVLDTDVAPEGRLFDEAGGIKTVVWRYGAAGSSTVHAITLLSTSGAAEAGKVAVTRDGQVWTFRTKSSEVKVGIGAGQVAPGVSADGEVWAARTDGGGHPIVVCGGAHAVLGGKDVASSADCAAASLP